jgi:transposase
MEEAGCPGCRELLKHIAVLEARIRELELRVGLNSTNSSLPPSANPPEAPKPKGKAPTGRKPGGQPGHQAFLRIRLPPNRVGHTIHLIPDRCGRCKAPLPNEAGTNDPEPTWHQVAELPRIAAVITEYQGHARTCQGCGHVTREEIPGELRTDVIGERLGAAMSYLAACPHVSKRGVEEVVETIFGTPISLGTVANLEQEMSQALAAPHAQAQQAVQQAPVKNVDETSWKQKGQKRWLWTAATQQVACFVIFAGRNASGLAALLGEKITGIVCSDRFSVYGSLATVFRQVCWAHLKRDFQKLVDRGGVSTKLGESGLATVALVFEWWHAYRGGSISRKELQWEVEGIRQNLRSWLEEGCACADTKTAAFCQNLLSIEPALWTFLYRRNVEPTNNHAERMLRSGVLWRKISFGCHSAKGCRFVERILTVSQTLRLQNRSVLDYLHQALVAHRTNQSAPSLVPVG